MSIKEHYKQILNERLFNPNNPIGKIETGIRKLGQLINPTEHRRKEREVASTRAVAVEAGRLRKKREGQKSLDWLTKKALNDPKNLDPNSTANQRARRRNEVA